MNNIYFQIAIILIFTKIGGMISSKFKMPQVLGALIAGLILGPSILGLVNKSASLELLSNLGVIMLMFLAGLETNITELKKAGLSSLFIALGGVILPLILGTASAYLFFNNFYENLFIGVILTATSVSISVQTLNELGKLNSKSGINILGAAVIDDVIGLFIVSFVLSLATASKLQASNAVAMTIIIVSIKILVFCIGSFLCIVFLPKILDKYTRKSGKKQRIAIFAIALALLFAFAAESLGIAAITGAYVCGLVISSITHKEFITSKVNDLSIYFLTPIFFASIGISANIRVITIEILILTLLMFIVAIFGKIVGCGLTARAFKMTRNESIQVGVGMISRGEVALITTNLGLQNGIISEALFIPTLIVVVLTTLITPILLKLAYAKG